MVYINLHPTLQRKDNNSSWGQEIVRTAVHLPLGRVLVAEHRPSLYVLVPRTHKVVAVPRLLLFIHQIERTDPVLALEGAHGAPGEERAGLEFSRSPAKRPSPQVAGPRESRSSYLVLPTQSGDGRSERWQQVGLTARVASSRKDKAANCEPHEQPTNGSSLARSQALP